MVYDAQRSRAGFDGIADAAVRFMFVNLERQGAPVPWWTRLERWATRMRARLAAWICPEGWHG